MREDMSPIAWLRMMEFTPDESGLGSLGGSDQRYTLRNVLVVVDDTDVIVHAFTDDRRSTEDWSARLRNTPASIIIPVIESALKPEPGTEIESSDRQYSWQVHGGTGYVPDGWECPGQG